MKHAFYLAMAASLMGSSVSALSCIPPDVARTYNQAAAAEERFIILLGQFAFRPPATNNSNVNEQDDKQVQSTFEGQYLGREGFSPAPPLDVMLNFMCFGPWCGSLEIGEDVLVFAEQDADGYTLNVDACYSTVLPPSDENVQRVEACMRGDVCEVRAF